MQTNLKMQIFKTCKGIIKAQASSMSFPSKLNSGPMYRNALFTAFGYYLESLKELPKPLIPGNWKLGWEVKISKQQLTEEALNSHPVFLKSLS